MKIAKPWTINKSQTNDLHCHSLLLSLSLPLRLHLILIPYFIKCVSPLSRLIDTLTHWLTDAHERVNKIFYTLMHFYINSCLTVLLLFFFSYRKWTSLYIDTAIAKVRCDLFPTFLWEYFIDFHLYFFFFLFSNSGEGGGGGAAAGSSSGSSSSSHTNSRKSGTWKWFKHQTEFGTSFVNLNLDVAIHFLFSF